VNNGCFVQCKDIPTLPILKFVQDRNDNARDQWDARWCNWASGDEYDVHKAMPEGLPDNLVLAKMRKLIRAGYLHGCGCGCRGDFTITDKGRTFVLKQCDPAKTEQP